MIVDVKIAPQVYCGCQNSTIGALLLNTRVSIVSKDERSYKSDVYCIITFVCTKQIRPRRSARHENTPISRQVVAVAQKITQPQRIAQDCFAQPCPFWVNPGSQLQEL